METSAQQGVSQIKKNIYSFDMSGNLSKSACMKGVGHHRPKF